MKKKIIKVFKKCVPYFVILVHGTNNFSANPSIFANSKLYNTYGICFYFFNISGALISSYFI